MRPWMRSVVCLVALLVVPTPGLAATFDLAYYFGLVTSNNGTTVNDGWWRVTNCRGVDSDLTYTYSASVATATLVHAHGDFVLESLWEYSPGSSSWALSYTIIYALGANTLDFCGVYDHTGGYGVIPQKRCRFTRSMAVGATEAIYGPCTLTSDSSTVQGMIVYSLQKSGLTVSSTYLPSGSSSLSGCLYLTRYVGTGNAGVEWWKAMVLAGGRGEVLFLQNSLDPSSSYPVLGQIIPLMNTKIVDWGTGSPYYGSFTSSAQISSINSVVDGLSIPTSHTTGTRAVVIPLM